MTGAVLRVALWIFAVAAVAVMWASYVPAPGGGRLDLRVPFTQLVAVRPALASALALVAAIGLACTWRRRAVAAAFALVLAGAGLAWAQMAPRALGTGPAEGSRSRPSFVLMTANTLRSNVAPPVIVDLVRRSQADVVTLPETNADRARQYARALTADGGERWRAYGDGRTGPEDRSAIPTSIVVRAALGPRRLPDAAAAPRSYGQVRLRLTRVPAQSGSVTGPAIVAVHVGPPAPVAAQEDWRRDILALRGLCRAGWVVGGDLNATLDHSPMRALRQAGCADAAAATGSGLSATWTGGPRDLLRLVLDHILTSGAWHAAASGVLRVAGSDHRAAWARITTG